MPRWYKCATAFFILQGMAAFNILDRLLYGEWLGKPGNKLTQTLNLLLIATSLALFCRGATRIRNIRTGAALTIGLAVFLLCSAVWSINPQSTITTATLYLLLILGSIGIADNLKTDDYMDLLAVMCFSTGVASLILFVVSPANALSPEGDFRGIFSRKMFWGRPWLSARSPVSTDCDRASEDGCATRSFCRLSQVSRSSPGPRPHV